IVWGGGGTPPGLGHACQVDTDCDPGLVCVGANLVSDPPELGVCKAGCSSDDASKPGTVCAEGKDVFAAPCSAPTECPRAGESCEGGVCVDGSCTANSECQSGQVCSPSGKASPGNCIEAKQCESGTCTSGFCSFAENECIAACSDTRDCQQSCAGHFPGAHCGQYACVN